MRILVLTFYFEPDLCAGSFRASALVRALASLKETECQLDVLTTMPNRYETFRAESPEEERRDSTHIRRIPLPNHRSGLADQSKAFAAYARGVLSATRDRNYDLVFATSSRLMTAALGAVVARRTSARLYLDIRDIFTDTLTDLFAGRLHQAVLPALRMLEARTIRAASKINLVSPGFVNHFRRIREDLDFTLYTNGIDDVFIGHDFSTGKPADGIATVLYAGNIGEGQGLDRIVPEVAERLAGKCEFVIVGDGGMRGRLESRLREKRVSNVRIVAPVPREQLIDHYCRADVLFLHLNDYPAFRKVLPSKLFEFGATGKPVLAGVAGYASDFVRAEIDNAAVFDPCDAVGMIRALNLLKVGHTPRPEFIDKYRRSTITRQLAADVLATLAGC